MQSSEQLVIEIVLYAVIFAVYAGTIAVAVMSRSRGVQWTAFCVALLFLENVVTFPVALFGYGAYDWLLGNPSTTLYLSIVLTGLVSAASAAWLFMRFVRLPRILDDLPALRIDQGNVLRLAYALSLLGCGLSIVLSTTGYHGYYMSETLMYEAPTWLGIARLFLNVCLGLSFIVYLSAYTTERRMKPQGWALAALWSFAGIATAFKSYVILPFLFIGVAAWLNHRLRPGHVALMLVAVMLAYAVVEPMRQMRYETNYTALQSLGALLADTGRPATDSSTVAERVMQRVDFTVTGVETLEADRDGRLTRFKARLDQAYTLLPLLAFVPAAIWPDKPLADLGRDLSIALAGIETNSLSPSHVVASYLWLGFVGVILNTVIPIFFAVIAGKLLDRYGDRPLPYLPIFFLMLVFSITGAIMAFHYVTILRAWTAVAIFYAVATALHLTTAAPPPGRRAAPLARSRR